MRRPLVPLKVWSALAVALACTAPETLPPQPPVERNKAVVRQAVEVLNERRLESLGALVTADFIRHSQATPGVIVRSLEDFKQAMRAEWSTFPDWRLDLELVVAEGDKVAVFGNVSGTQEGPMGPFPSTGLRMELDFGGVFRLEDGKIAELWITWDNLATLRQLGHLSR